MVVEAPTNRPSCFLDTSKLETLFPDEIPNIRAAVENIFEKWRASPKESQVQ
jgi:hypothetical protein